ncbi:MAG: PorT family protein [Bacteroidetes bacterium]|nr:PorT family protein [Bacteroidota bacterium]
MKRIITIIFAVFIATTAFAQENKYTIGLVGFGYSPNYTILRGNEMVEKNLFPDKGFTHGISFKYNLKKSLSLQTELLYESKAVKVHKRGAPTYPDMGSFGKHFDYITIPFLFQLSFGKKIVFFSNTGIFMSYLIKETDWYYSGYSGEIQSTNNTKSYKRIDAGITTGLGIAVPIKKRLVISLELRNNLGLFDVNEIKYLSSDMTTKTNSTNLLIGLAYKFGKK